jgi:hypothetical protein
VHLTLDFDQLLSRFADMFHMVVQRGGTLVYTDSLMHVGRRICSFNSAWNVLPSSLCKPTDQTLGMSSPLAFNHRSPELARDKIDAAFRLRPGRKAHMLQGSYDSLSNMLAKTVFCASNNLHLSGKLAERCVYTLRRARVRDEVVSRAEEGDFVHFSCCTRKQIISCIESMVTKS